MTDVAFQKCIVPRCAATYAIEEAHVACPACGGLLDVAYDWNRCRPPASLDLFESKWCAALRSPVL